MVRVLEQKNAGMEELAGSKGGERVKEEEDEKNGSFPLHWNWNYIDSFYTFSTDKNTFTLTSSTHTHHTNCIQTCCNVHTCIHACAHTHNIHPHTHTHAHTPSFSIVLVTLAKAWLASQNSIGVECITMSGSSLDFVSWI